MINHITPDKEKARALVKMSEITLQRLHEFNLEKYPSNTLIDYYDTIHKILEAIAYVDGIKCKGEGAHQQLIDYVYNKYFSERDRIFLQEMRDYRNRIHYEGFTVNVNYIKTNSKRIEGIIKDLMLLLKKSL